MLNYQKQKNYFVVEKIDYNGKAGINQKSLQDEFINLGRGDRRDTTKHDLVKRIYRTLQPINIKLMKRNA